MTGRALPLGALVAALIALSGCDIGSSEPFARTEFDYTFEATLAPWVPDGTDLENPPVAWSIERSNEQANQGEWSVKLELENLNDAGKIWMETGIQRLTPGVTYDIRLAFDFGSSDTEINAWTIIAGVSPGNPETVEDLTFRESTAVPGGGFTWTRKEYEFTGMPNADGMLWISIGVWGTSEFTRTYFIDDVEIEVVRGG